MSELIAELVAEAERRYPDHHVTEPYRRRGPRDWDVVGRLGPCESCGTDVVPMRWRGVGGAPEWFEFRPTAEIDAGRRTFRAHDPARCRSLRGR